MMKLDPHRDLLCPDCRSLVKRHRYIRQKKVVKKELECTHGHRWIIDDIGIILPR
jgi:hypothetical protein